MKSTRFTRRGTLCLTLAALAASVLTTNLQAQDEEEPPQNLLTVRTITVKADQVSEFVDLQRELSDAMKEAGRPGRHVWQQVRGDTNVFHITSRSAKYAELDESGESVMSEGAWANWVNAIQETIVSREITTYRSPDAWAIPFGDDYEPNMVVLTFRTVAQGDGNKYRKWFMEKLIPAYKELGVKGSYRGQVRHGGSRNTYYTARHISSWAELDEPGPASHLSDEERAEIFDGLDDITFTNMENVILRHRASLSYDN